MNNLQDLIDQMKVDEEQAFKLFWLMHNKGFSWIVGKEARKQIDSIDAVLVAEFEKDYL